MINKKGNIIVSLLVVIVVFLIGGCIYISYKSQNAGVITLDGGSSANPTVDHFLTVDGLLRIGRSPDGFILWDDFTVATTSPVRGVVTNSGDTALMCDGKSAFVLSSSTAAFAPSFKFALGTTTSSTAYSANLLASTTVATTTQTITTGPAWNFILERNASITLSVGDYVAAIASSTYYGNWAGQFGIHCWSLGE